MKLFTPLILVFAMSAQHACSQVMKFNTEWWGKTLSDEQQGFIYGYQDCRQPSHTRVGSVDDYQNYVTKYLSTKLGAHTSVPVAIRIAEVKMPPRRVLKGGEMWSDPHGFLNGGWWGLPNMNDLPQQNGFVEGYLLCAQGSVNANTVKTLVIKINKHYMLPKSEHDPIADVLRLALGRRAT